jgi:hypothetical protein
MLGPAEIHYLLEHTLYRDGEALAWDELTFNQQVWALNEMWQREKKIKWKVGGLGKRQEVQECGFRLSRLG